jgi:D-apiose dehydrogenase
MLLDHEGGVASIVDCSYATRLAVEPFPETLVEVDGSEGSVRLNQGYELVVVGKQGVRREDVSPPLLSWASRPWHNIQESVLRIQQHWVDCLREGRIPDTSGSDNLKTFALVEAAYLAARIGQTVETSSL